ncbi:MAG: LiaF domain-containing protein [Acetobacterium sp.]
MKIKKILIGSLAVYATCVALYSAVVFKKGKEFESTLDKSPESMDDAVIFGGKLKLYNGQIMQDLRVGAFCGGMQLDFTDVITPKKEYHMEIKVLSGGFNIIVPDNFNISLVDHCLFGGVANNTVCDDPENAVSLSVFADIAGGGLNFENTIKPNIKEPLLSC